MTRRTLVVVWGVGPSLGRGRGVTRPDFAAGPFPEGATLPHFFPGHFLDTLSYLCPVHWHSHRGIYHSTIFWFILWAANCTLEDCTLQTVPWRGLRVALEGVGIGWTSRRALYNKRYRNDLPRLEKSDMKNPKFDISAFLHRPSYQLIKTIIWKTDFLSMFPFLESSYCLFSLPSQLTTSWTRRW